MAQMVKNLSAMRETQFPYLGQEDPLGKGVATHSSILAWRIPWTKGPDGLQSMGLQRVGHDQNFHFHQNHEAPVLWPPDVKSQLIGKDPDAGEDRGQQRMRWLDSITDVMDTDVSKLQEVVEDTGAWHATVHGLAESDMT